MLYIIENIDKLGIDFIENFYCFLSEERNQKIQKYKFISDKVNGCAVYILLRYSLKKEYGIDTAPEFIVKDNGKPYLKDYPDIFFNLSHCKNSAACIISDSETAVDINDFRKVNINLAKRICSDKEISILEKIDKEDKEKEIIRLWSVKECFSKITGEGIRLDFRTVPSLKKDIYVYNGKNYVCAAYNCRDCKVNIFNGASQTDEIKKFLLK